MIRLIVTLAVVLGAGAYFLGVRPLYDAIHKGLDLQGGVEVLYQATATPHHPVNLTNLQATEAVINYRVNKLGVTNPTVQLLPQQGRILVQLPGVKNQQAALNTIGSFGNLEFKDDKGNVIVTGAYLKSATATQISSAGTTENVVNIAFDSTGVKKFAAFTAANQGKTMGIYLNGKEIENPVIEPGCCPTGQSQISGNFSTLQQASYLAIELNSGALPLGLTVQSQNNVSATLGAASIKASEKAALVAIALVAAFMFLTYRIPGFWADIALLVYALVFLGVLVGINATLTLPGITGLILSIGMAVDSNVIIYERIKEELRAGRSLRNAVDQGFHHGLRAIVDSNATTVIASVVLYYLGSGLIRGFALTVGIGVVISLLTAVVFTRYLLNWLVSAGANPSNWFFAPRAEVAVATAGGPAVPAARPLSGRSGRFSMANLRRDWQADLSGPDAPPSQDTPEPAEPAAAVAPAPAAVAPAPGGAPPTVPAMRAPAPASSPSTPAAPAAATNRSHGGGKPGKRKGTRKRRGGR